MIPFRESSWERKTVFPPPISGLLAGSLQIGRTKDRLTEKNTECVAHIQAHREYSVMSNSKGRLEPRLHRSLNKNTGSF